MKRNYFISNLWRSLYSAPKSLSPDNGSGMDWKCLGFESARVSKFAVSLSLLLFLGIGSAWGTCGEESMTAGDASYNSTDEINTWSQTSCTVVNSKYNSSTDVSSSNPGRWYKDSKVTFTPVSGYTITKIVLSGSEAKYNGQSMSASTGSCSTSSNTTTWTGAASSAFYLEMGKQFRFGSVTIYYCYNPTSPTNTTVGSTSARVSWTDTHDVGSYEVICQTSSTPPALDATPTTTVATKYADLSLSASTTYYWWVRAKCANDCKSVWVAGTSFTTTAAAACGENPTAGSASLNGSFCWTYDFDGIFCTFSAHYTF